MEFSQLGVSTITVMAYSNVLMNVDKLFDKLAIHEIENPPLTKKKKLPNIPQIDAPYGSIISLRAKNRFRGLVTKRIETQAKYFLNQITCVISLGNKQNINVFIFKTSFKVVGCKEQSMAEEVITILWEDYIKPLKDCYEVLDDDHPNFVFETVMTNVDFSLGFSINRKNLNTLLNSPQFSERIKMSRYETTGDANVNVQFHTERPPDYFYWRLIDNDGKWEFDKVDDIMYCDKRKKKKKKYTTFLVFHSSKTIASARYNQGMEKDYNYFMNIVKKYRPQIEEKLQHRDTKKPFEW